MLQYRTRNTLFNYSVFLKQYKCYYYITMDSLDIDYKYKYRIDRHFRSLIIQAAGPDQYQKR